MIPHLSPFELEIKMADEDEPFRKCRRITPELMADFEKPVFSLRLEILKNKTTDGEPASAVETPNTSEISNQDGSRIAEREGNSDSNSNSNSKIVFRHKSQAIQSKKRSLT